MTRVFRLVEFTRLIALEELRGRLNLALGMPGLAVGLGDPGLSRPGSQTRAGTGADERAARARRSA